MGKLIDEEFVKELIQDCDKIMDTLKKALPANHPMKKESFESFLQDKFCRENPCILDDDIPDAFSEWIANADPTEVISWAEEWGKKNDKDES